MRHNSTERISVNAIERIFIEDLCWIFREQSISDVGIDAMVEVVVENNPTGRFIAVQIKSGSGNFNDKEKSLTYYASDIHYNYWTNCNVPVILIGYILEQKAAYWQELDPRNFVRTKRQWKIEIPKKQKLGLYSKNRLLDLVGLSEKEELLFELDTPQKSIEQLQEEVKNIRLSRSHIHLLTDNLSQLTLDSQEFNEKADILISKNRSLKDPEVKALFNRLAENMAATSIPMEKSITAFADEFAKGIMALYELVLHCKTHGLQDILINIKNQLGTFSPSIERAINQVVKLKKTVDSISGDHKLLKQKSSILSDILNQIIREFKTANEMTWSIIRSIEE